VFKLPLKLTIKILNSKGEVERTIKGHSFVKNMLTLLSLFFGAGNNTGTYHDILGNPYTTVGSCSMSSGWQVYAASGSLSGGIVVGIGTNINDPSDYSLNTMCLQGTDPNQLLYSACSLTPATVAGADISFNISRSVTNGSGSTITINEIGILGYFAYLFGNFITVLMVRDKLTTGVVINDGETKTIQYTWTETNT
jgi:hypothetical protein